MASKISKGAGGRHGSHQTSPGTQKMQSKNAIDQAEPQRTRGNDINKSENPGQANNDDDDSHQTTPQHQITTAYLDEAFSKLYPFPLIRSVYYGRHDEVILCHGIEVAKESAHNFNRERDVIMFHLEWPANSGRMWQSPTKLMKKINATAFLAKNKGDGEGGDSGKKQTCQSHSQNPYAWFRYYDRFGTMRPLDRLFPSEMRQNLRGYFRDNDLPLNVAEFHHYFNRLRFQQIPGLKLGDVFEQEEQRQQENDNSATSRQQQQQQQHQSQSLQVTPALPPPTLMKPGSNGDVTAYFMDSGSTVKNEGCRNRILKRKSAMTDPSFPPPKSAETCDDRDNVQPSKYRRYNSRGLNGSIFPCSDSSSNHDGVRRPPVGTEEGQQPHSPAWWTLLSEGHYLMVPIETERDVLDLVGSAYAKKTWVLTMGTRGKPQFQKASNFASAGLCQTVTVDSDQTQGVFAPQRQDLSLSPDVNLLKPKFPKPLRLGHQGVGRTKTVKQHDFTKKAGGGGGGEDNKSSMVDRSGKRIKNQNKTTESATELTAFARLNQSETLAPLAVTRTSDITSGQPVEDQHSSSGSVFSPTVLSSLQELYGETVASAENGSRDVHDGPNPPPFFDGFTQTQIAFHQD